MHYRVIGLSHACACGSAGRMDTRRYDVHHHHPSLPKLPMLWILLLSLLLLCWLFLASDKWVWWKAGAFSLLLLMLSAWWLIDKLSGDGLNAATLYHLGADMEGAGVSDFKGYIAGFIVLALVSLLPLFATRVKRWRRPGHGGALFAGFAAVWVATIMISPLARDGQRLYQQLRRSTSPASPLSTRCRRSRCSARATSSGSTAKAWNAPIWTRPCFPA